MTTDYTAALTKAEGDQSIVRAQMTLARLGEAWARDTRRGLRFIKGLTTWLSSYTNENTRRVNSYSVLEFFEWYEANRLLEGRRGQIPAPWQVTREDANAYAQYLRTRPVGLEEERLRKDPTKKIELTIYAYVKGNAGTGYSSIRKRLLSESSIPRTYVGSDPILEIEKGDPLALDRVLACMVEAKQLTRQPTIEELRRSPPNDDFDWARVGLDFRAPPEIFRYEVDAHTDGSAEERSSTVLRRVAALSALWRHYIERGENTQADQGELLKYNIWADLVKREGRIAPLQQRVHRLEKTPSLDDWKKLVATTESGAIEDIRDRALLALMFWMGLRVTEMVRLKRKDRVLINGGVFLRLLRKRSKAQLLAIPRPVIAVLDTLDQKIAELARDAEARQESLARKIGGETSMLVPRWRRLLENPDAPLIPAVARWGCNASMNEQDQDAPITRQAVTMMLRRRGFVAGIPEADWSKLHPHGFRRLGARAAFEAGTPLTTIQTALGHDNIATTGKYVEDRDQERVGLFPQFLFPDEKAAAPESVPSEAVSSAAQAVVGAPPSRREQREAARAKKRSVVESPVFTVIEAEAEAPSELIDIVEVPPAKAYEADLRSFSTGLEEAERGVSLVTSEPLPVTVEEAFAASSGLPPPEPPRAPSFVLPQPAPPRTAAAVVESDEPEGEGLIGLSACAPLEQAGVGSPDYAYEPECWGESHRNACGQIASERIKGTQDKAIPGDVVSRSFVGRGSRLTWWSGTGDNLSPRMPIFSPEQLLGGGNFTLDENGKTVFAYLDESIIDSLGVLWSLWATSPADGSTTSAGPTAAAALLRWVAEAVAVGGALRDHAKVNGIQWIDYERDDLAVDVPDELFKQFRSFRQHREDEILQWFYENARTYRVSRGAETKGVLSRVDDRPTTSQRYVTKATKTKSGEIVEKMMLDSRQVYQPSWYSDEDPILSLADEDRQSLLDLIRGLTGQHAGDTRPRYTSKLNGKTASLADLVVLLGEMCSYDGILSQLEDRKEGAEYTPDELREFAQTHLVNVSRTLGRFGWETGEVVRLKGGETVPGGYAALVMERKVATARIVGAFAPEEGMAEKPAEVAKQKKPKQKKVMRDEFYLNILASIFGKEVESDPILKIEAKCDGAYPLAGSRDFFAIDDKRGTIVHSKELQSRFAEELGTHSECVARRIARDLWELRQAGSRVVERADELAEHVDMLRAYRVPCPASLEKELVARLPKGAGFTFIEPTDLSTDALAEIQLLVEEAADADLAGDADAAEEIRQVLRDQLLVPNDLVLIEGKPMRKVARPDVTTFKARVMGEAGEQAEYSSETRKQREIRQEQEKLQERYAEAAYAEAARAGKTQGESGSSYNMNPSQISLLPNPVALLFAAMI